MITVDEPLIIGTKFNIPKLGPYHVRRSQILKFFPQPSESPVVLLSAPAGYGKTSLITEWIVESKTKAAWLSLDSYDDSFESFLLYLAGSLYSVFPGMYDELSKAIGGIDTPPKRVLLAIFIREIEKTNEPFALVLDDYHHIHSEEVHSFLTELVHYQPGNMMLVFTTRRDPPFPLVSWRASGKLIEFRQDRLTFSGNEISNLTESFFGIKPDEFFIEHIRNTTEGWAVGLYLLYTTNENAAKPLESIISYKGSALEIGDYFASEILAKEAPEIQSEMKRLSILDRFNKDLYNHLLKKENDDDIDFKKLIGPRDHFIMALDDEGIWFRFHNQFLDLLRKELSKQVRNSDVLYLHQNAARWFEANELQNEAIRHAILSGNNQLAAEIFNSHYRELMNADAWAALRTWIGMFPVDMISDYTGLLLAKTWLTELEFRVNRIPKLITQLEQLKSVQTFTSNENAQLYHFKGMVAYWNGEADISLAELHKARELYSDEYSFFLGELEVSLGLSRSMKGESLEVVKELDEMVENNIEADPFLTSRLLAVQVFFLFLSGHIVQAKRRIDRLKSLAEKNDFKFVDSWGTYLSGALSFQNWNIDEAVEDFKKVVNSGTVFHLRGLIDSMAGLALSLEWSGDSIAVDDALDLIDELSWNSMNPYFSLIAASCRSRVFLLRGDITNAMRTARSINEGFDPASLFLWLESPMITKARVLIASGSERSLETAHQIIRKLKKTVEKCNFNSRLIDLLILESLILEKKDNGSDAELLMAEAVELGEPSWWIRSFIEPGRELRNLLKRSSDQHNKSEFIEAILKYQDDLPEPAEKAVPALPDIAGTLTNRELDVLQLLVKRLQDKEIGNELSISTETVRSHMKSLFRKLEVSSRRQAALRADELGLIQ